MVTLQEPKGRFVKVRCANCKNEQVVFGKCATKVNCLVCNTTLAEPVGGKSNIVCQVLEILG